MSDKTRSILTWTLSIVFGLLFLLAGQPKLFGSPGVLDMFGRWGYPPRFAHVVGLLEMAGGIGLMIPRFSRTAAMGLLVVMLGAFGTHVFAGEWMRLINVAVFSGAVFGIYKLRQGIGDNRRDDAPDVE